MMDFGQALRILKDGGYVARDGWNGKGMKVEKFQIIGEGIEPFFVITTPSGRKNTWVPSISDCLAEDWLWVK